MDLKIIKEKETPLLSRKRLTLEAAYEGATPSKDELSKGVAKLTSKPVENVEIRHVYTKFGRKISKIIAHVYNDKDVMNQVVKKGKKQLEKEEERKKPDVKVTGKKADGEGEE